MALIGGLIFGTEELVKDVIIPYWVTSEIIGAGAIASGVGTAAVVNQV